MPGFNTGVSGDSGGVRAANQQLTIPAGVIAGDVVLFVAEGFAGASGATLSASSTGTTPILLDQNQTLGTNNGLFGNGAVWKFKASGTDAGKVITITLSGGTNPFWSASLGAYTGFSDVIDVHGGVAAESTSSAAQSTPALTTGVAGDWAIYLGALGIPAGGTNPAFNEPSGTTSRQKNEASSSICSDICDSNGSVGPGGTGIGGSGKQYQPNSPAGNTWYNLFTVGLSPLPAVPPPPARRPVPMPARRRTSQAAPTGAAQGIRLVGQAGIAGGSAASPASITYSSAPGNTLIISGHLFDNNSGVFVAPTSITDSTSGANIWQVSVTSAQSALTTQTPPLESLTDPSDGASAHMADFIAWCVGAQAVTSITIAWEGGVSTWRRIVVAEFAGIIQFDNSWAGGSTTATTSVTAGPVYLSVPGELVIAALDFGGGGTQSFPAGWTLFTSQPDLAYYLPPATGSYSTTVTDTVSNSWVGALAVFSPVSLSPPISLRRTQYRPAAVRGRSTQPLVLTQNLLPWQSTRQRPFRMPARRVITGQVIFSAPQALPAAPPARRRPFMQILRRLITGQPLRQATQGAATLNAGSVLSTAATAGPDLAALWAAYLAAAANSAKLVDYWRQLHSSSRTDGTVGQIYAQLYVADQAKDAAYKAWEIAWRRINSQAPPSGPAT